jgi:hypothetical protein
MATMRHDHRIDDPLIAARIDGYVISHSKQKLEKDYYSWCLLHDNPFVSIIYYSRFSHVLLNMDTCRWTLGVESAKTGLIDRETIHALGMAVREARNPRSRRVSVSSNHTHIGFYYIPRRLAPWIARCLYHLAMANRPPNPGIIETLTQHGIAIDRY